MLKPIFLSLLFLCLIFSVSAVPPFQQLSDAGFSLEASYTDYHKQLSDLYVHSHIYNSSNGVLIDPTTISCYYHAYDHSNGSVHLKIGTMSVYGAGMNATIEGSYFDNRGLYSVLIWCNDSNFGGFTQYSFLVNEGGAELFTSQAINFNIAMLILIILFILSVIGIFYVEDYRGKFALYWVAHFLFTFGSFVIWQFNETYEIGFLGLSAMYKVMFYVSITSVFPMIILSLAWIFYIHTVNDDMRKMMDRGMDEDEAYDRSRRRK